MLKKMNERITDSLHITNEGKIFKSKMNRKLPKLNEFPENLNLKCSNINGAMHKLMVGERLTGAKFVC